VAEILAPAGRCCSWGTPAPTADRLRASAAEAVAASLLCWTFFVGGLLTVCGWVEEEQRNKVPALTKHSPTHTAELDSIQGVDSVFTGDPSAQRHSCIPHGSCLPLKLVTVPLKPLNS